MNRASTFSVLLWSLAFSIGCASTEAPELSQQERQRREKPAMVFVANAPSCVSLFCKGEDPRRIGCVEYGEEVDIPGDLTNPECFAVFSCTDKLSCATVLLEGGRSDFRYLAAASGRPLAGQFRSGGHCFQFLDNNSLEPVGGVEVMAVTSRIGISSLGVSDEHGLFCVAPAVVSNRREFEGKSTEGTLQALVYCKPGFFCGGMLEPTQMSRSDLRVFLRRFAVE